VDVRDIVVIFLELQLSHVIADVLTTHVTIATYTMISFVDFGVIILNHGNDLVVYYLGYVYLLLALYSQHRLPEIIETLVRVLVHGIETCRVVCDDLYLLEKHRIVSAKWTRVLF
jgi:hypothetical protein